MTFGRHEVSSRFDSHSDARYGTRFKGDALTAIHEDELPCRWPYPDELGDASPRDEDVAELRDRGPREHARARRGVRALVVICEEKRHVGGAR